ncbi:MAG: transcriptional regulator, family [Phenylobacterium sp.]|nr:transcriptional regulator, family [Phenylobacterium sp.]
MLQHSATYRTPIDHALAGLVRVCGLSEASANSLRELIGPIERYPAAAVVSSIAPAPRMKWILSGWVCELRVLPDGRRQIFSFAVPGDVVLSRPVNASNPCSVVALTSVECIDVAQTLARAKDSDRTELWRAVNYALTLTHERRYEDIMRLGRRSAIQRLADLLLELHDRLEQIGMVEGRGFHLPLTQEHLADALGLSVVHVNRSLKALRLQNLATFRFGRVTDLDREGLEALCRK